MKHYILSLFLLCLMYFDKLSAQSYISVQITSNYWHHTEVYGTGAGFGYSYKFNKLAFSLHYDYGYGTVNRLEQMGNVNYEHWTTVGILTERGRWSGFLGRNSFFSTDIIDGSTDYGKQHQLNFQISFPITITKNNELRLACGLFGSLVEQFFTFTNVSIYYIDLTPFYQGPLNYIPVTKQKIFMHGVNFELSYQMQKRNNIYSPFIQVGLGPNYSSFYSCGMRLSTQLMKKGKKK
jgi:hypothetical protein